MNVKKFARGAWVRYYLTVLTAVRSYSQDVTHVADPCAVAPALRPERQDFQSAVAKRTFRAGSLQAGLRRVQSFDELAFGAGRTVVLAKPQATGRRVAARPQLARVQPLAQLVTRRRLIRILSLRRAQAHVDGRAPTRHTSCRAAFGRSGADETSALPGRRERDQAISTGLSNSARAWRYCGRGFRALRRECSARSSATRFGLANTRR
jgi:hypothetical protein